MRRGLEYLFVIMDYWYSCIQLDNHISNDAHAAAWMAAETNATEDSDCITIH
jgi:hypothetical protein